MRSPPFFRPFSRPGAWSLATCRRTSSSKAAWKNHGNLGRKSWEHIQKWWENDGNMGKWWENLMGRSELLGISEEKKSWFLWTSKFTLKTSTEFSGCRKIGCLLVYQFIHHFWGKPVRAMVKAWYMWYGNLIIGDSWSWFYKSLSLDWWSSSSIRKNNPCFDETGGLSFGWLYINTSPLHPIVFR